MTVITDKDGVVYEIQWSATGGKSWYSHEAPSSALVAFFTECVEQGLRPVVTIPNPDQSTQSVMWRAFLLDRFYVKDVEEPIRGHPEHSTVYDRHRDNAPFATCMDRDDAVWLAGSLNEHPDRFLS